MAVCIDPFSNTLNLSPLDWLKVAVLSLVLVPVRIVLCVLAVCLTWSCAYLVTVTMNEADLSTPLTGWRDVVRHYCCHQTYLWYWAMGFRVSVVGERADRDRAPVLVAAPHSSFLDLLLVPLCRASAVTKMENKTNPLIGVMQVPHFHTITRSCDFIGRFYRPRYKWSTWTGGTRTAGTTRSG